MGASYGIPGVQADGMDVLKVYESVKEAVDRARDEHVPTLLEIKTYRYKGHSMTDPGTYRTRDELEKYRQQDPILIFKAELLERGVMTEDDVKTLDSEVKETVEKSVTFSEESPEPGIETLVEDVLSD